MLQSQAYFVMQRWVDIQMEQLNSLSWIGYFRLCCVFKNVNINCVDLVTIETTEPSPQTLTELWMRKVSWHFHFWHTVSAELGFHGCKRTFRYNTLTWPSLPVSQINSTGPTVYFAFTHAFCWNPHLYLGIKLIRLFIPETRTLRSV